MSGAVVPDWLAGMVRPQAGAAALAGHDPRGAGHLRAALYGVRRGPEHARGAACLGGLMGTMADTGGSHRDRLRRVTYAAVLGGPESSGR